MSEIDSYAKYSFNSLNSQAAAAAAQDPHNALLTPAQMLQIFSAMRQDDLLQSPLVDTPEFKGQPWLDAEVNVPYSLRPRIPAPPEPELPQGFAQGHHGPAGHSGATSQGVGLPQTQQTPSRMEFGVPRIDSQSRLFESPRRDAFSPMRFPHSSSSKSLHQFGDTAPSSAPGNSWGYPPGFQQPQPVAVESIQWVYTDPNGMTQGPFASGAMHQWFVSGWLRDDLCVKRVQDAEFVPIGILKARLETDNPFAAQATQDQWAAAFTAQQAPQVPQVTQVTQPQQTSLGLASQQASRSGTPFGWSSMWGQTPNMSQTSLNPLQSSLSQTSLVRDARRDSARSAVHDAVHGDMLSQPLEPENISGLLSQLDIQSDEEDVEQSVSPIAPVAAPISAPIAAPEPEQVEAPREPISAPVEPKTQAPQEPTPDPTPEPLETPVAAEPEVAPWLNKPAKRAVSLAEIQGEAKRKAEATKAQQQLKQQHSRAVTASASASQIPQSQSSAPGTGGAWATPVSAAPHRSVADIQREQALAQKNKAAATASQPPKPVSAWSGPGFNEAARAKAAPSAAHMASPPANSPWKTVGRKSTGTLPTPANPTAQQTPTAAQPAGSSATPKMAEMKPASRPDELIQWCKVTFKQALAKDVNPDDLLSLFLTIPATSDGKDFIADSIYSYSATLDGRRFASEFIQRRKQAEADLKNQTWNDVLAQSNPNAVEADASFQVVKKKQRFRQIAKPTLG